VLTTLASGPKHGYALIKDVEAFAGVRLGPGTLRVFPSWKRQAWSLALVIGSRAGDDGVLQDMSCERRFLDRVILPGPAQLDDEDRHVDLLRRRRRSLGQDPTRAGARPISA